MSHITENFVGDTSLFDKKSVIEKFFARRGCQDFQSGGGGVSQFSFDYFMSHSTKTFVGAPLSVSLTLGIEKVYAQSSYHYFLSEFFCLTVPKNFVREFFCVSENSWYPINLWIRGVEVRGFTIRNRKNIWHDRVSNPWPTASEPCCPTATATFPFWTKRVGNFGQKKNRPYWKNIFFLQITYAAKINKSKGIVGSCKFIHKCNK